MSGEELPEIGGANIQDEEGARFAYNDGTPT